MYNIYDAFFFGAGAKEKSMARRGIVTKKWAAINIFYQLLDLVRSRFRYTLDDGTDPRFLELCLIYSGRAAFCKDATGEVVNAEIQSGNAWSKYGYLINCTLTDFMGRSYGQFIPDTPGAIMPDCVFMYDNRYNVPPISRIKWYADRLALIQGSINSCIINLRGNVMINCTVEQKKVIAKQFEQAADGVPIFLAFDQGEGALQLRPEVITNPQTGEVLTTLMETYDKTLANFLTEFGINANGIINKLSGISDAELRQNEQMTQIKFNSDLNERKEGLERVNAMFGKKYKVEPNFQTFTDAITSDTLKDEVNEDVLVSEE